MTVLSALERNLVRGYGEDVFDVLSVWDEEMREALSLSPWCKLPGHYLAAALATRRGERLTDGQSLRRSSEELYQASMLRACYLWRFGRGIYQFDATLFEELCQSKSDPELNMDVVMRLPEWCVYLRFPSPVDPFGDGVLVIDGAFVSLDMVDQSPKVLMSIVAQEDGVWKMSPAIGLDLDVPLGVVMETTLDKVSPGELSEEEMGRLESRLPGWFGQVFRPLVLCLLYVCAANADFTEAITGDVISPGPRHKKAVTQRPVVVHVGYRVGAALRGSHASAKGSGAESGRSVAPHLRRAHWHRYWVGAHDDPERHTELRWLHPTLVTGKSEVAVLHKLQKKVA